MRASSESRRTRRHVARHVRALVIATLTMAQAAAQVETPALRAGSLPPDLLLDGRLDEPAWEEADLIDGFTMTDPVEGGQPSGHTVLRVLTSSDTLVIGFRCDDPNAAGIVSYSVARDSSLRDEDHMKIVLGTFLDGYSGYVFAVNPSGARYDALVSSRGEREDARWDGVWEARTSRDENGWSAEIRIPILTLAFASGVDHWHLNAERRVQRLLEVSRWASPTRDYRITQTSVAGLLTGLPDFSLGLGLSIRPSAVVSHGKASPVDLAGLEADASLDVTLRLAPNLAAALTVNTDFAEAEVDTRRTNLTRFPLFFPEKRRFFLEGSDAFDFGLGLGTDVVPYHSRRIGLVNGEEVPVEVGGRMTGRLGGTSIGALAVRTGHEPDVAPDATMGVVRLRQDVLEQSSVGMIATGGDPLGRGDSWLGGADFTYQTSKLFGNRNFLAGAWALAMDRGDLPSGPQSAWGAKIDYPNDRWDIAFTYKRIGENFDPSLGFVPRRGINTYRFGADFAPRPDLSWLRKATYEFSATYITDLKNRWESFRVFTAPVNWDFESGDQFEFNVVPVGERIDEEFEIADGVVIAPGEYKWARYRVVGESATKRTLSAEIAWWFGPFYDGMLDTFEVDVQWRPIRLLTLSLSAERNVGHLPQGDFTADVYGLNLAFNISPDLTLSSFVQYDSDSHSIGTNTRLKWQITPLSELFVVGNINLVERDGSFRTESYESIMKFGYEVRF